MGLHEGQRSDELELYVCTINVPRLVRFYKVVFDAVETHRFVISMHAVGVRIASCHFTVIRTDVPTSLCKPMMPVIYVPNVESAVEHAKALGGRPLPFLGSTLDAPVVDTLMGDHACRLIDPAGYLWEIRSWRETVTVELAMMRKRLVDQHRTG